MLTYLIYMKTDQTTQNHMVTDLLKCGVMRVLKKPHHIIEWPIYSNAMQ